MTGNKNPLDILRKEHIKVLKTLDSLENALLENNLKQLESLIRSLEKDFNAHSLNKEEKFLFVEMEKFMPREGGPTGMMVAEHRELVKLINNFQGTLKSQSLDKLQKIGGNITSILRQHIDKENNILFMMAEMHLDDKQKQSLLGQFTIIS